MLVKTNDNFCFLFFSLVKPILVAAHVRKLTGMGVAPNCRHVNVDIPAWNQNALQCPVKRFTVH